MAEGWVGEEDRVAWVLSAVFCIRHSRSTALGMEIRAGQTSAAGSAQRRSFGISAESCASPRRSLHTCWSHTPGKEWLRQPLQILWVRLRRLERDVWATCLESKIREDRSRLPGAARWPRPFPARPRRSRAALEILIASCWANANVMATKLGAMEIKSCHKKSRGLGTFTSLFIHASGTPA